jgi:hypothetical protein
VFPKNRVPFKDVVLNGRIIDWWSLVHLVTGVVMGAVINPFIAIALMVLYEPFEIYIIYPMMYQNFGIVFGNESWVNSMSDIVIDVIGVCIGYYFFFGL